MPKSLSSKLRCLRRDLVANRQGKDMCFDLDQLKHIARYMPKTNDDLCSLIPENVVSACGERILEVTKGHGRDQDKFEDCVKEINAFLRGGLPGMAVLGRVYRNILKWFEMENDMEEVFDTCKIYIHSDTNQLKRKRNTDEEDVDFQHGSQM